MHNFMGYCELCGEERARDVDQSHNKWYVADRELKVGRSYKDFEVYHPGDDHGRIKRHPEIRVFLFEHQPLLWAWVAPVQTKELIEDGKAGVYDADVEERIEVAAKKAGAREDGEYEVGSWRVHETVGSKNIDLLSRESPLYRCDDRAHNFNRD